MKLRNYQQIQVNLNKNLNFIINTMQKISDQVGSSKAHSFFNFALDVVKPYLRRLGLRIAKLSQHNIELVFPEHSIFLDFANNVDEGAIASAAIFGIKKLLENNFSEGQISVHVTKFEFEKNREIKGTLRLRSEINSVQKEIIFAELTARNHMTQDFLVQVFDKEEMLSAKIQITVAIKYFPYLHWGKT